METKIFQITRSETAFTGQSREILREQFGSLPAGQWKVTIQKVEHGKFTPTRYKYYFSAVMTAILEKCATRFQIIDHSTGEQHPPRSTSDIHEIMKGWYNPVTIITPKGSFTSGETTTGLSDRDFIGEFLETILAEFSGPPYNVDFLDYDDWREMMKAKRGE